MGNHFERDPFGGDDTDPLGSWPAHLPCMYTPHAEILFCPRNMETFPPVSYFPRLIATKVMEIFCFFLTSTKMKTTA